MIHTLTIIVSALLLVSCAIAPMRLPLPAAVPPPPPAATPPADAPPVSIRRADDNAPLPPAIAQAKSRWVPVRWAELPGFEDDKLFEAWNAWLKSCERPGPVFAPLCADARRLSIASPEEQRS